MKINYKISIPKPCNESWDKMTPDETGRFCSSCVKSVVDFSEMKASEIQDFFIKNQGQKVCGRFRNEQLDSIIIQVPRDILFSQVQFHKIFLLALLVSMGTTLFSCQGSNGDKQKIDKVEVVDSTKNMTLGLLLPPKDSLKTDTAKSNTVQSFNFKVNGSSGVTIGAAGVFPVDSSTIKKQAKQPYLTGDVAIEPMPTNPTDPNQIYPASIVEIKPEFPGGLIKFYEYINSNVKIPQQHKTVTGKLIFTFMVNKDGSLSDIKLLRGINKDIDNEVLRVLELCPKWNPGEQNGEKVRVSYSIPIKITASE
ncbi:MAG: energy transducer TonB [Flavobacterium sp.]